MSAPIDDGGPAFPHPVEFCPNGQVVSHGSYGMTLRAYFASKALPSKIAEAERINDAFIEGGLVTRLAAGDVADACVVLADALIAALKGVKP